MDTPSRSPCCAQITSARNATDAAVPGLRNDSRSSSPCRTARFTTASMPPWLTFSTVVSAGIGASPGPWTTIAWSALSATIVRSN